MPLITVFLREQGGFNYLQLGIASAIMALPMLFSPALITFFADRNVDPRRILAIAFTTSALVLSAIYFFWMKGNVSILMHQLIMSNW